jgi:acyl-coenzyme A thioesterase PaaI-like protein
MTPPPLDIGALMHQVVPLVNTLGLEYGEISAEQAVVTFRDQPEYRNHVGGPHAAALFAAAESATGAAAIAAFGDLLDRAVLLPMTANMEFLSIALGDITATARITDNVAEARQVFESGVRPEFEIVADLTNSAGDVTGRLVTRWTLKKLRTQSD